MGLSHVQWGTPVREVAWPGCVPHLYMLCRLKPQATGHKCPEHPCLLLLPLLPLPAGTVYHGGNVVRRGPTPLAPTLKPTPCPPELCIAPGPRDIDSVRLPAPHSVRPPICISPAARTPTASLPVTQSGMPGQPNRYHCGYSSECQQQRCPETACWPCQALPLTKVGVRHNRLWWWGYI